MSHPNAAMTRTSDPTSDPASEAPGTQWLRTRALHRPRELSAFQEAFTQALGGIHVEPLHGHPLAVEGSITHCDGVAIHIGHTTPSRCIHAGHAGSEDAVQLTTILRGGWQVQTRAQAWDMAHGDTAFAHLGQAYGMVAHTPALMCGVILSRSALASMAIDVDAALLRPLRAHPAARLLAQYAHLLREPEALASPALRRAATLHMYDLAALVAGATGEVAHLAGTRGVRGARLLAVKNDIAAHFTEAALSVADVARRQGITPRYLQMLLEREGLTFSALVLEQRLALAHRRLQDPRLAARAVSAIALDAGFGDLSHFNRSFRRRYGLTPSDARISALGALGAAA